MREITLIIHNIRSAHNVGSLLRTAEGLGVNQVIITGYSPYPAIENDPRLPHEAAKATRAISKTALGAEESLAWRHEEIGVALKRLGAEGYVIAALEQAPGAVKLAKYQPPEKIALIVGNEVLGIDGKVLDKCEVILEIPMSGQKESFNVAAAAAMTLFYLRNF